MVYEIETIRGTKSGAIIRHTQYSDSKKFGSLLKAVKRKGEESDKGKKKVSKKRKKSKFLTKKFTKKPRTKLPSVSPKKFLTKGLSHSSLVREDKTSFFKPEQMDEEGGKWL